MSKPPQSHIGWHTYASFLAVRAPVLDDDTRAVDDLAGVALPVENAYNHPVSNLSNFPTLRVFHSTHKDQPTRRAASRLAP